MAADTQLLRIQYVADTAGLQQSKTAAEQAQRATDQLRDSAKKLGQEGAAGQKQFQGSIGQVRAEMEKTRVLIELTNRSETKLLNERIAKYKQLRSEVDAFNKKLQETDKATKANVSSFGQLGNIISATLGAAAIRQVVTLTLDMATLSGNIEGVSRAFARLPNSILLLDSLRKGTHGAVTDLELMQKALQANNFRIPLQNLGKLFEFAAAKAQQTGQEVNHLVDYIVSGIGYRSIKRLDDLGFTANRVKEALGGVTLQAATMQQVMSAVTKLMDEDLKKTGGYAETTATKVQQITVSWEKLRETVAKRATNAGLLDFIDEGMQGIRDFLMSRKDLIKDITQSQAIKDANLFIESIGGKDVQTKIEDTQQKLNSLQQTIGRYNDMIRDAKRVVEQGNGFGLPGFTKNNVDGAKRWNELTEQYGKRAHDIWLREQKDGLDRLKALTVNKKILEETIVILKQYFQTLDIAPQENEESLGLIAAKLQEIEDAGDRLKAAKTTAEIHSINNELSRLNAELADLKAFGTTKQFLEFEGKVKLVPVTDPKDFQKKIEQEPIFRKGVTISAKIGFTTGTRSSANSGAGGVQGSLSEQIEKQLQDAIKNIPTPNVSIPINVTPMTDWERVGQEFAEQWKNVLGQGLSDTGNFLNAVVQSEADAYAQRLSAATRYYDELIILAGDNEKKKDRLRLQSMKMEDKLRRESFEADKRAKKSQAAINGAVGITNAFATLPYPAAIVASLLIAASTAAQIAIINKETPRFKKGKVNIQGPGTKTSDSIHAKISRGESVINASSTERSSKLLEGINSGRIDDRILDRLHITKTGVKYVGMDDRRIVAELKKHKTPDLQRVGRVLHEVQTQQDGFSKRVRRKTMSS